MTDKMCSRNVMQLVLDSLPAAWHLADRDRLCWVNGDEGSYRISMCPPQCLVRAESSGFCPGDFEQECGLLASEGIGAGLYIGLA